MGVIENNHASASEKARGAPTDPLAEAWPRLKEARLRMTRPRRAILDALAALGRPARIEEIHARLPGRRCDLATVYRSLAAFEEAGLARRVLDEHGTGLYSLQKDEGPIYHLVCRRTGRPLPVQGPEADELTRALAAVEKALRDRGFDEIQHSVAFFGVAPPDEGPA